MSTTGKVFAVLVFLLAIASVVMVGAYVSMRNAWMERVSKAKVAYESKLKQATSLRDKYDEVADRLQRKRLSWNRSWDQIDVTVKGANTGVIDASIGTNQGLKSLVAPGGAPELPILYAFQPEGDGYKYVGEFRASSVGANQSSFKMMRTPKRGETKGWENGSWRFRDRVPYGELARYPDLIRQLTVKQEQLKKHGQNVKDQKKLAEDAQEQLDARISELRGDPEAAPELGSRYRLGYVESLRQASKTRNEQLQELDRLRLKLKAVHDQFNLLRVENTGLADQFSQGESSSSATAGKPAVNVVN